MDILGILQSQADAAVGPHLAESAVLGRMCVGISAAKSVENRVEIIACTDSGGIEDCGTAEILVAISLGALVVKTEASGRGRCGSLSDGAGHSSAHYRPVAFRSLVDIDLVILFIDKDQITGAAAVALCLLVHSVDIRNCTGSSDLISVNSGIRRDGAVSLDIIHGIIDKEPTLCAALFAIVGIEIIELFVDGDKAARTGTGLLRVEIVIIVADLPVTGQDLADADSLRAALHAGIVSGVIDLKPSAAEIALFAETKQLILYFLDTILVILAACVIVSVILADLDPACFRYSLCANGVRRCCFSFRGCCKCHDRHAGQHQDHKESKQHGKFFLHKTQYLPVAVQFNRFRFTE